MTLVDYIGRYWAGAEVIYGVIIAMTFTSVLRETPGVLDVVMYRVALTALFCCIAWGLADGLFYFWERSYIIRQENRIIELSKSAENGPAVSLVGEQLDDTILRNIPGEQRTQLYQKLVQFLSGVSAREKLSMRDSGTIIGGTFIRSACAGLVVVTPFFLIHDVELALKISNLLGILLLFLVGYVRSLDKDLYPRVVSGIGTSLVGIVITSITVVLGG
jgi:VIT1/CCC1 family predicted Fe2+/Mn2+ transporter